MTFNTTGDVSMGEDTFEHILQATQHHEAVWTYYYMDENNKVWGGCKLNFVISVILEFFPFQVKVTEIFDVTDSDSPIVQSVKEREVNQQLQFDDDWDESTWMGNPDEHQCK